MRVLLQSFSLTGWTNLAIHLLQSALLADKAIAPNIEIKIVQSDYFDNIDDVFDQINLFKPDVVGFSVFIWSVDLTEKLIAKCLSLKPKPFIVCGGRGLHALEKEYLTSNPGADVIVRSEGENTFKAVILHLLEKSTRGNLKDIEGIFYRTGTGIVRENPARTDHVDLSETPSVYKYDYFYNKNTALIETSRFCPGKCSFCSWSLSAGIHENCLSIERIKEDLDCCIKKNYKNIYFIDAAINHDTDRFLAILDAIENIDESPSSCTILFFLRYDYLNSRQLDRLAAAKKIRLVLYLGLESISRDSLRIVNRPYKIDSLKIIFDTLSKNPNLELYASLIYGLPADSPKNVIEGIKFITDISNAGIYINLLTVLPGSPLRDNAEKYGIKFQKRGVPFIIESNTFPKGGLPATYKAIKTINTRCGHASRHIHFNSLLVPYGRIKLLYPPHVKNKKHYSRDSIVNANVVKISNGFVDALDVSEITTSDSSPSKRYLNDTKPARTDVYGDVEKTTERTIPAKDPTCMKKKTVASKPPVDNILKKLCKNRLLAESLPADWNDLKWELAYKTATLVATKGNKEIRVLFAKVGPETICHTHIKGIGVSLVQGPDEFTQEQIGVFDKFVLHLLDNSDLIEGYND